MDDLTNIPAAAEAAGLPYQLTSPVAMPIEMQRTYFASVARILRNPSLAYRKDAQLMKQMRNDPDCMGPLTQLQVSIAGLDWQIKPFNSRDPLQEEIADRMTDIMSSMPRLADMMRHMLDAVWYGSSAVNVIYERRNGVVRVSDWIPIHPDTLVSNIDGRGGIRVGPFYYGSSEGTNRETTIGFNSLVHLFDDVERKAVLWHRYMVQGPDFDDPYETAYATMGKGVRDTVWWYWNLKQAVLQNWATYAERYAQGIRVGYYPMAQKGGKEEMETILRNLVGDVSAVVPRTTPGQKDYEIEIKEPGAARAQVFADLCEWLAKNIKELIVGQSATSESVSSGIGSSVATEHGKTFTRQLRFVANGLAETITEQFVKVLVDMNFGEQEFYPRFEFSVEAPEMEKKLEAIRVFVNELGGTVSEAETRKILGLAIPDIDEPVLTGKTRDVMPTASDDDEDFDGIEDDGQDKVLSAKQAFAKMSDQQLRREGIRRRRAGRKPAKNCGNGFGGFTDSNKCAGGPHEYPKTRASPGKSKKKNALGLSDDVIAKHRVLLEEGYADDQAWGIAFEMSKIENRRRPQHATESKVQQDRAGTLVAEGLSVEQAIQVAEREDIRSRGVVSKRTTRPFEKDAADTDENEKTGDKETFNPPVNQRKSRRKTTNSVEAT